MKKIIQSRIFLIMVCGLLFTSIGVYGATIYNAEDVIYSNKNSKVANVNDALDELYVQIGSNNAFIFTLDTTKGVKSYTIQENMKNALIFINDIRDGYSIISVNGVEIENERVVTSDRNGYVQLGELKVGDILSVQWSGASPVAGYYTWMLVDAIPNKID